MTSFPPVAVVIRLMLLTAVLFAATSTSLGQTLPFEDATAEALSAIDAVPAPAAAAQAAPSERVAGWASLVRFFAPGLIVAASIGTAGSVLGTFVLLRREALIALALPQVVAVGAAIGMRAGWPTLPPALVAVAAAVVYLVAGQRRDGGPAGARGAAVAAPALYVAGLCGSFLLVANGGQHVEELRNLFTGIDVAVTPAQAAFTAPLLLCVAAFAATSWRRWLLIAQAPAAAVLGGVRVRAWDATFVALLATAVLVGTNAQGTVMVLAMLFLPPAIVAPWARRLPTAMAAGVAVAWLALAGAFACSVANDWPLSHSLGGVASCLLVLSILLRALLAAIRARAERSGAGSVDGRRA